MESLTLSIRPPTTEDPKITALPALISRISQQRGHLRNVTEESLIEEVDAAGTGDTDVLPPDDVGPGDDIDKPDDKDPYAAREEMMRQLGYVE